MSSRDAFERALAALNEAMLDDAHWPTARACIDAACRVKGGGLVVGAGDAPSNVRLFASNFWRHGQRDSDYERLYFEHYYHHDERVPRLRGLPDRQLAHVGELYSDQEKRTSATYNEFLSQSDSRDSVNVRMNGPEGARIVWGFADPIRGEDWSTPQVETARRLLPHLRQYVRVRHALVRAGIQRASLASLLDHNGLAALHLGRSGRIAATNDRALRLLRQGSGILDRGGWLRARHPTDDTRLQTLLAGALPRLGGPGASGTIAVRRSDRAPRLAVHVSPFSQPPAEHPEWHVGALVLIVDPTDRARPDPDLVRDTFGLSPSECRVAIQLAEGRTVSDIAAATGRQVSTVRWHVHQVYTKLGISREVDLVRLVLSLAGVPFDRR